MKIFLFLIISITSVSAQFEFAENDSTFPSPEMILKVYNYMLHGTHGAILYDTQITSDLKDDGFPLDALTTVNLGDEVMIWMNFLLPANHVDENYSVIIQRGPIPEFVNKPVVRRSNNKGSLYSRITRKFKPKRPGTYSVKIYRRDIIIKEYDFIVVK